MSQPTHTFWASEPPGDPGATRSATDAMPAADSNAPPVVPGFDLRDEVGSGGMGVVYRAHDLLLGRDVAVKLLLPRYGIGSSAARRFAEEARITARLPHPGIPPVHQVGTLSDGRPYLVMKLIEGQTLDKLLKERTDPRTDHARFATIFEHICHAVAFAHSRGFIHRDLKPANVMVGQFAEVQVMDWGLAKQVGSGQQAVGSEDQQKTKPEHSDPQPAINDPQSAERPSATPPDATIAGSVLGTPAYMSPEQARGEVDKVGPRSDVFGLGAILSVILAGEPPFDAPSSDEARQMGMRGDLEKAFTRLDQVGGEPELVALCKRCLAPDPADRPADAREVADAVQKILEGAEERAVQAELDRARVETRSAELRKRRRVWAALGSAVILLALALWWADHQQAERRREREVATARDREGITAALDAAEVALHAGHLTDADAALALARKRLEEHPDADPDNRYASLDRDREMLRELEKALDRAWTDSQKGIAAFDPAAVLLYPATYERYGLKIGVDDPEKIAEAVRASRISDELTTGLREWYIVDHTRPGLRDVLNRLDPDPLRVKIRAAIADDNPERIRQLAAEVNPAQLAPGIAVLLGMHPAVAPDRAVTIMAGSWRANPGNFPLALRISFRLESLRATRLPEAIGWCRVAVALRPRSAAAHKLLANALFDSRDHDGALAEYRAAIAINPKLPRAHLHSGIILKSRGELRTALESFRAAIQADPQFAEAYEQFGEALTATGDHPAAVDAFRTLARLRPKDAPPRIALARALRRAGLLRECADTVAELETTHPACVTDCRTEVRFDGARAAALCANGADAPPVERAVYRARALAWGRAELAALGDAKSLPRAERLRQWLTAPEFTDVRDPARLAELPPAERTEWDKFWIEVRSHLNKNDP